MLLAAEAPAISLIHKIGQGFGNSEPCFFIDRECRIIVTADVKNNPGCSRARTDRLRPDRKQLTDSQSAAEVMDPEAVETGMKCAGNVRDGLHTRHDTAAGEHIGSGGVSKNL